MALPPPPDLPKRKPLGHGGTPAAALLGGSPDYFITVCAEDRTSAPLLPVADAILESVRKRNEKGVWYAKCAVVMPDHVHLIVAVPRDRALAVCIGAWKRYLARTHGIRWQANFFDHRLRNAAEEAEKREYIRMNPVRKGLAATPADWPWHEEYAPPAR